MLKFIVAAIAIAAAAPAVAGPVGAGEEQVTATVNVADLDLAKPGDAARLDRRIRQAAVQVCGEAPTRNLALVTAVQGCQKEAIGRAKAEVTLAMRGGGNQMVTLRAE